MPRSETSDRPTLTAVFYPTPSGSPAPELGWFTRVEAQDMPAGYRGLLAHDGHMTVTMELCHLSKVEVEVLDRRMADDGKHYSRKILLRTPPTAGSSSGGSPQGRVVQFGIARMNLDCYPPDVREEVLSERTPLGRVLISHGLLMKVRLLTLWRVEPGPDLCRALEIDKPTTLYGRTAMIDIDGEPVIELLEISAPLELA
jgi:chorismate-pyruvate lyase